MPIEAGKRYVFINKKSGTALDLDTRDNRTVQGWARHGGPNQQWEFFPLEKNWLIKNVGQGSHLTIDGPAQDGTKVICTHFGPHTWQVLPKAGPGVGDNEYRFHPVGSQTQCIDLADHGSSANGTSVQLWTSFWGSVNQIWVAHQV